MIYVDVILPLPLEGLFTYSVPKDAEAAVMPFVRVKVPFGITKTHTALVVRKHHEPPPDGIPVTPSLTGLDEQPVALSPRCRSWRGVADY